MEELSVGAHNLLKNIVISTEDTRVDTASPKFSTSKQPSKSPSVFEKESITQLLNNSQETISKMKKKQKKIEQTSNLNYAKLDTSTGQSGYGVDP